MCLQDKALLRIGAHLLEGKIEKLKKPYAVLKKRATPKNVDSEPKETTVDYRTIAILRNKIIFRTVPKPVGYGKLDASTYA